MARGLQRINDRALLRKEQEKLDELYGEVLKREIAEHTNGHITDYDPVLEMAKLAVDAMQPREVEVLKADGTTQTIIQLPNRDLALSANKEVAKYVRPQLKQIEHVGGVEHQMTVRAEMTTEIMAMLEKLARGPEIEQVQPKKANGHVNANGKSK